MPRFKVIGTIAGTAESKNITISAKDSENARELARSFGLEPQEVLDESEVLATTGIPRPTTQTQERTVEVDPGGGFRAWGIILLVGSGIAGFVEVGMTQSFVGGILRDELHIYRSMTITAALFLAAIICFATSAILNALAQR